MTDTGKTRDSVYTLPLPPSAKYGLLRKEIIDEISLINAKKLIAEYDKDHETKEMGNA